MTAKELYLYAIDQTTEVIEQVLPYQLSLPTPDTEWDVQQLLEHITYELAWTADIVAGKTISEVGAKYEGDLLDNDYRAAWQGFAELTRRAVMTCDESAIAHLSYADRSVAEYLFEAGNDQLIHAWDLGQAVAVQVIFNEAVAEQLYERAAGRKDELAGSGLFAPPVPVADNADTQTKLLGLLGRSESWRRVG